MRIFMKMKIKQMRVVRRRIWEKKKKLPLEIFEEIQVVTWVDQRKMVKMEMIVEEHSISDGGARRSPPSVFNALPSEMEVRPISEDSMHLIEPLDEAPFMNLLERDLMNLDQAF
ncbi:hypothetical protein LWI29_000832 [Acer saccharum]|uniref:Uncharacterized protein n=1 Tax=Acer saccharum TaxID=4024 RepID=A0AA39SKF0_ACESA|nr:hypothetical protein LWI29_000832 [Acer saccharum]